MFWVATSHSSSSLVYFFFFFNDPAPTEISPLPQHDALPIWGAFPAELETKPNEVDQAELREAVGKYWEIDEVRPAFIHAHAIAIRDAPFEMPPHDRDDKDQIGRAHV